MKRIVLPSSSATSLSTALRRSSNSPRYFAPAMSAPTSSEMSLQPRIESGTSWSTIRCASPSTTAVLPTPGSPMSTGLFFRRRESTCIVRRISSSRPMTGSSAPSRASCVRSVPYLSSASRLGAAGIDPHPCRHRRRHCHHHHRHCRRVLLPPPPPPPGRAGGCDAVRISARTASDEAAQLHHERRPRCSRRPDGAEPR